MEELSQIDKSLSETLRNSDLKDISVDIVESIVDSTLEDGILKDLPIVGSILRVRKTAMTIKDQLFLKKILSFLSGLKNIPIERRKKMIDFVNERSEQKMKIGEKLIYILDKCDDYIDAKYISQLFCAFLKEEISYEDFLRGSRIIQNIFISDLECFLDYDISRFKRTTSTEEAPDEEEFPLINVGILGFGYTPITVEESWEYQADNQYIVKGGDVVIWVTSIGGILKNILRKENI